MLLPKRSNTWDAQAKEKNVCLPQQKGFQFLSRNKLKRRIVYRVARQTNGTDGVKFAS